MSEKMGAGELAKLARLNSARTGGEWARPYVLCLDDEYAIGVEQGDEENSSFLLICDINEEPDNYADNADFIVAAANAMPRLLNHIATLQREADEAKAEIARLEKYCVGWEENARKAQREADGMREALEHTHTSLGHAINIIRQNVDRDALGANSDGDADVPGGYRSWPLLDEYLHYMDESMTKCAALLTASNPKEKPDV